MRIPFYFTIISEVHDKRHAEGVPLAMYIRPPKKGQQEAQRKEEHIGKGDKEGARRERSEMAEEEQENGTTGTLDMAKAHALEHTWTLWFDNPSQRTLDTYGQSLKTVYTFSTVEDFWRLYNNLLPPSRLNHGTDFHLFKQGIEPKWEDANCEKGGKWLFTLSRERNKDIDAIWEELVRSALASFFAHTTIHCVVLHTIACTLHLLTFNFFGFPFSQSLCTCSCCH